MKKHNAPRVCAPTLALGLVALAATLSPSVQAAPPPDSYIVGGDNVPDERFSFVASLHSSVAGASPKSSLMCSASLIATDTILTAAHCVTDTFQTLFIAVGERNLLDMNHYYPVAAVYIHPNYLTDFRDDIAIVKLATHITGKEPVRLAQPSDLVAQGREEATVVGWGLLETDAWSIPSHLQMVKLRLHPKDQCDDILPDFAEWFGPESTFLCAGEGDGKGVCFGDSGGPLLIQSADGEPLVAGITSWGSGQCGSTTEAYTDVSIYTGEEGWLTKCLADPSQCGKNTYYPYFTCDDGVLIPALWQCDDAPDCASGEDETGCLSAEVFTCIDGEELPWAMVCDDQPDCASGEDENPEMCDSMVHCDDGTLIPEVWLCDGFSDCSAGEDESEERCDPDVLTTVTAEVPGDECPYGGSRIDAGTDDNHDGILQPEEVETTTFLCDDAPSSDIDWDEIFDCSATPQAGAAKTLLGLGVVVVVAWSRRRKDKSLRSS